MTDDERDQIDTDAETYMRTCSVAIQTLKNEGTTCINNIHFIRCTRHRIVNPPYNIVHVSRMIFLG